MLIGFRSVIGKARDPTEPRRREIEESKTAIRRGRRGVRLDSFPGGRPQFGPTKIADPGILKNEACRWHRAGGVGCLDFLAFGSTHAKADGACSARPEMGRPTGRTGGQRLNERVRPGSLGRGQRNFRFLASLDLP